MSLIRWFQKKNNLSLSINFKFQVHFDLFRTSKLLREVEQRKIYLFLSIEAILNRIQ